VEEVRHAKRALAAALCTLLLFAAAVARPALAAGPGAGADIRIVETGRHGYTKFIASPPEGGRRFVVPVYEYATWEQTQKMLGGTAARVFSQPPRGVIDSYNHAGGLINMLRMAVGNWDLFWRGCRDVWAAVNESADLVNKGMANLNDPAARYEFWKSKGIYDKYNAGERAFLNQVVMPVVAVGQWALGGLAGSLTGVGVAFGLASVLGLALGPGALIAGGIALGLVAVSLIGHFKGEAVREKGGDINAVLSWVKSGVEKTETGKEYRLAFGVDSNGILPTLEVFGIAGSAVAGLGGVVGGYLTAQQEHNILATYNAYGIPEVVSVAGPPVEYDWKRPVGERVDQTWELIYSLVQ